MTIRKKNFEVNIQNKYDEQKAIETGKYYREKNRSRICNTNILQSSFTKTLLSLGEFVRLYFGLLYKSKIFFFFLLF